MVDEFEVTEGERLLLENREERRISRTSSESESSSRRRMTGSSRAITCSTNVLKEMWRLLLGAWGASGDRSLLLLLTRLATDGERRRAGSELLRERLVSDFVCWSGRRVG